MYNFVPILVKRIYKKKLPLGQGDIFEVHGQSNRFQATPYNSFLVNRMGNKIALKTEELELYDIVYVPKEDLYAPNTRIPKKRKNSGRPKK